jgi:hypothetical protein
MVKGSTLLPYRGFPYREIAIHDVNNLNLQSPMPDVPISDARVDLGLPPSGPSFPRTPVQLHLYSTKPRGPTQPRHFLLSCDRESRDRGFTGRNSFASQNPECRIPTSRDLCHLSLSHQRLRLNREIAIAISNQHETLYLVKPRYAEYRWPLFLPSCA